MVLDMHTDSAHSLKQKRQIVASIKEKLKNKFNISLIESDYQDLWQKTQLSVAMAANSRAIAEKTFQQIEDFIFSTYPVKNIAVNKEFI
jgi:uncharacterized protein YlxP (DUF503 family)